VVQKSGSWFSYGETRLGQGKEKAVELLTARPDLVEDIRRGVYETLQRAGAVKLAAGPSDEVEAEEEAYSLEA